MKKKDMIFDFYIDKSEPGKPLRVCTFCKDKWRNNDRRRLIDHMIGCPKAPKRLKEELLQRDKKDALTKQAATQQKQASQQMAFRAEETNHRRRSRNWISKTEEEYTQRSFSDEEEEHEEGRQRDTITREERENLDRLLIEMIYQCELPISLVMQPSFLAYIKSIRPAYYNYGLPKTNDIANAIVEKIEQRARKVRKQIRGVDFLGERSRSQDASFYEQEGGGGGSSREISYRSQGLSDRQSRDLGIGPSRDTRNLPSPEWVIRERERDRERYSYPSTDPEIAQSRNIVSQSPSPERILRARERAKEARAKARERARERSEPFSDPSDFI
ncbi:uncharacterized protein FA14DRAFT_159946 [Meira miltonrushii]|uniref:Uncharacterized protein n=1 Tax=Meira miltonrushii TaxID=1280837 RepID=A0A316VM20_9BASI|nr:uncharacterized protein FA14DRAFT_159946 [Meira miltonrushii]PWN38334.1 hypothetical protein FA14DRAFT_159946 [Meira miltonrushii]